MDTNEQQEAEDRITEQQQFENIADWVKTLTKMYRDGYIPVLVIGIAPDGERCEFEVTADPCVLDVQDFLFKAAHSIAGAPTETFEIETVAASH